MRMINLLSLNARQKENPIHSKILSFSVIINIYLIFFAKSRKKLVFSIYNLVSSLIQKIINHSVKNTLILYWSLFNIIYDVRVLFTLSICVNRANGSQSLKGNMKKMFYYTFMYFYSTLLRNLNRARYFCVDVYEVLNLVSPAPPPPSTLNLIFT